MKGTLLFASAAFALGLTAGYFVQRSRQAPRAAAADPEAAPEAAESPEAGEEEGDSGDLAADLKKAKSRIRDLKAEIAELKKQLDSGEEAEGSPEKRAKELRAKIAGLVEKQDGAGLVALMKDLAALGEPGWKGALEIAELFRKQFGNGDEAFGLLRVQFNKAFTGALTPLMVHALENPGATSAWFRGHAVHMLYWVSDVEPGPIFMEALAAEKDANIATAMAQYLQRLAKPEMSSDLAEAARIHAGNPKALAPLIAALVDLHSPESASALRDLAGHPNAALRAAAEVALVEHSPPAPGILITATVPKSQAATVGLQKGDILMSYDGKDVVSLDQLRKAIQAKPDNELVTVMVNRKGTMIPVQIKGQAIGIDGRYVKPH